MKKSVIFVFFLLALFFVSFQFNVKPAYASEVSITLTSSPATGLGFVTINGTAVTTPYTFSAPVGTSEIIAAVSPANTVTGQSRYVWASWSDSGAQSHTITAGSSSETYTANFQLQYYLNVSGGYSTTGQGWYNSGTSTTASSNWLQSIQGNTTGLVGLWHLDEGTGTVAYDGSGNGNNGTIYGASYVGGEYGDGLSFSGVDSSISNRVEVPDSTSLELTANWSISCWLKIASMPTYAAVCIGKNDYHDYSVVINSDGTFRCLFTTTDGLQNVYSTYKFSTGIWYFASVVRAGGTLNFYVNGQLVYSTSVSGSPMVTTNNVLSIGACKYFEDALSYYPFNGTLDDVRIYNRARGPSEILALYPSRMAVTNWQLDGVNQNLTRQNTGTLTTSSIIMSTYHVVTFLSTTQYLVSFQPMDNSGSEAMAPSSFQIKVNNSTVISVPSFELWLDSESKFQIYNVIWENADVKPTSNIIYTANGPLNETILLRVFNVKLVATDCLGIPISGAQVTFTLANGTTIRSTTGSDGTLSLGLIPIWTFRATISYLGTTTEVNGDASVEPTITVKLFASYPTFSLIGGGIIIVAVGSVLVRSYRRSPALQARFKAHVREVASGCPVLQAKIKGYFRVNWGAPFIVGFMLLLVVAAVSLSMGLSSLADAVAVYAYYALVVGIVLQLASFLKYRKRDGESE